MRVKILFNKKETALVQMCDSTQAQLGNSPPQIPKVTPLLRNGSSSKLVFFFHVF